MTVQFLDGHPEVKPKSSTLDAPGANHKPL